jgi:hypothetical protein
MARQPAAHPERGFSLVEVLVALAFTMVLMAGMATVFRSSITTFYTSGEKLASVRRNRSAMDLMYEDLNAAGMFLTDLSAPPTNISPGNPAFYVLPNMPIADAVADGPATADELYFYYDQPLAFEATLVSTGTAANAARTASELVLVQDEQKDADRTFRIECRDANYAESVKKGQQFIFKDFFESMYVDTAVVDAGNKSQVVITAGPNPTASITGSGPTGAPAKSQHIVADGADPGSGIVFYRSAQMVKYSIQMRNLDPGSAGVATIPCLVRQQADYDPAGFPAAGVTTDIIAENVPGFKVYLSANSGQDWAGFGQNYSGLAAGWTAGIQSELNTQLGIAGRADYKTTKDNLNWFRSIPALVRLDITTRSAMKRAEYSTDIAKPVDYKQLTQSLVIVPRHFGLTMN